MCREALYQKRDSMHYAHKMLIVLIAAGSTSSFVCARAFTFLNDTKDILSMRFKLMGNDRWWEHAIKPGTRIEQDVPTTYPGAYFCIEAVQIGEHVRTGSVSSGDNAVEAYATVWKNIPVIRVCKHTSFMIIKDEQGQLQVRAQ